MKNENNISDEFLNSYVDNQLEPEEKIRAYEMIGQDDSLKSRVCDLREIKEIMQHAYQPMTAATAPARTQRWSRPGFQSIAAAILLACGGLTGWFSHAITRAPDMEQVTAAQLATHQIADNQTEARKIIVHLNRATPDAVKTALDETEGLLYTYNKSHRKLQIEVIANRKGVDMLRTGVSTQEKRITQLQQKYPNLSFMVCGQTVSKLLKEGKPVQLLPNTGIATSAADQINKRLHQGWSYVRI